MSIAQSTQHSNHRQWRLLFVYNIYRLVSIFVLLAIFSFDTYRHLNTTLYLSALFIYLLFGLVFLYIWHKDVLQFEIQVLWSGTIDLIVMVLFINGLGYLQSGLGILLNVSIAVLSILVPGRLAIFFAAVASCMFLGISTIHYVYGYQHELSGFFSTGIHGTGFFATSITAWYLSKMVTSIETLADQRGKALATMQRLNEYIIDRMQYGVLYVDMNSHVKLINTAARQFLNVKENALDLHLDKISPALYKKYMIFLSKIKDDQQSGQTVLDTPYLQVHFFSAFYADQIAVLIILDEMTNIAQQAQDLKLASLGRFSASIAHELRNPLGVISHAVQLMGEDNDLNKEDTRLRQMIIQNCERMNMVIKNVLQLSRREHSKPEAIKLSGFLKLFKKNYCLINKCNMVLTIPKTLDQTVFFDKSQLEQILIILCDNAMEHGREASGNVNITISVKKEARQMLLMVSDTGLGIPVKIRTSIFDPFFSTIRTGSGMGLFIARDLCEINQARLFQIETKQGGCFTITLNQGNEILI